MPPRQHFGLVCGDTMYENTILKFQGLAKKLHKNSAMNLELKTPFCSFYW